MEALEVDDPPSIGGYELRARLGQGGFGLVYLGLSPGGRAVAVKVLQRELARDAEFLRRFQLEVLAAQRVNGLYTAPVVGSGLDGRPPWVATAFVPGPPLDHAVKRHGPLPEPAVWRLLAGLVEALRDIHACGLVHRDLKPGNVLLAADGPRVIDFGISKALDGSAMTSTGAVFGTPAFMSPEQAQGLEAGLSTDVFALGAVLAYAATGAGPFDGGNAPSVLYRVVHEPPSIDGLPSGLREAVASCLVKDPAARPSLTDLAAFGRDGPGAAAARQSPASFWPPQVAQVIRDYQDSLDVAVTARLERAGGPAIRDAAWGASRPSTQDAFAGMPPTQSRQPGPVPSPAGPAPAGREKPDTPYPPVPHSSPWTGPGSPYGVPAERSELRPRLGKTPWREVPAAVRAAVVMMRLAGGLSCAAVVAEIFSNTAHAATAATSKASGFNYAIPLLVLGLFWFVVAEGTRQGRNWARVLGTALFGLYTILASAFGYFLIKWWVPWDAILILPCLFGGTIVVLLWLRSSGQYFQPR